MVWDKRGTRLFYGDDQGRIVIAFVPRVRVGVVKGGGDLITFYINYSLLVNLLGVHCSKELTRFCVLRRRQYSSW